MWKLISGELNTWHVKNKVRCDCEKQKLEELKNKTTVAYLLDSRVGKGS